MQTEFINCPHCSSEIEASSLWCSFCNQEISAKDLREANSKEAMPEEADESQGATWPRWEYKRVTRKRSFSPGREGYWLAGNWSFDIESQLNSLGRNGWELVSVVTASDVLGGFGPPDSLGGALNSAVGNYGAAGILKRSSDWAGATTSETWVFKRPIGAK